MSISALANVIAKNFDDDQLSLLGAVFTQLGDTLATISVQRALWENGNRAPNNGAALQKGGGAVQQAEYADRNGS